MPWVQGSNVDRKVSSNANTESRRIVSCWRFGLAELPVLKLTSRLSFKLTDSKLNFERLMFWSLRLSFKKWCLLVESGGGASFSRESSGIKIRHWIKAVPKFIQDSVLILIISILNNNAFILRIFVLKWKNERKKKINCSLWRKNTKSPWKMTLRVCCSPETFGCEPVRAKVLVAEQDRGRVAKISELPASVGTMITGVVTLIIL